MWVVLVLFVLWTIGMATNIGGGLIHVLLVIAGLILLLRYLHRHNRSFF